MNQGSRVSYESVIEITRRIALAGAVFAALWLIATPVRSVIYVQTVDFARDYKSRRFDRATGIEQHIQQKTEGRLTAVSGNTWSAFFDRIEATANGTSGDKSLLGRLARNTGSIIRFYFLPSEAPFASLLQGGGFAASYLRLDQTNRSPRYLFVAEESPSDAMGTAPAPILFPGRRHAGWVLLAGALVYVVLPWPRRAKGSFHYPLLSGCIAPDFLGCALGGLFFVLPILVIASNSKDPFVFNAEWLPLTCTMWALSALCMTILAMTAWQARFEVALLPDGILKTSLFSSTWIPYGEIASVKTTRWQPSTWLRIATQIVCIFRRSRRTVAGLLESESAVLVVRASDGREIKTWFSADTAILRILVLLQERGVTLDASVQKAVAEAESEMDQDEIGAYRSADYAEVSPAHGFRQGAAIMAIAVAGLALQPLTTPREAKLPSPDMEVDYTVIKKRQALLEQMQKEKAVLNARIQEAKNAESQEATSTTQHAVKESFARFQILQSQFEATYTTATTPNRSEDTSRAE